MVKMNLHLISYQLSRCNKSLLRFRCDLLPFCDCFRFISTSASTWVIPLNPAGRSKRIRQHWKYLSDYRKTTSPFHFHGISGGCFGFGLDSLSYRNRLSQQLLIAALRGIEPSRSSACGPRLQGRCGAASAWRKGPERQGHAVIRLELIC